MWKRNSKNIKLLLYIIFLLISIGLIILLLISEPTPDYTERSFDTLGTYVTVKISGDKVASNTLLDIIESELKRVNDKFSANLESSVVYEINKNKIARLDDESMFLIKSALNISEITGKAFDLTIRPLVELWGFHDQYALASVPDTEKIKEYLNYIDYRFVKIDENNNSIEIINENTKIDLGGIAKGYAIDRAINRINEIDKGATGFINAGGDIGIIGPKYGKLPWAIGIRDPKSSNAYDITDIVYLYNGSIVTSGNYERYIIEDNVRYHHILDPKTGFPANNAISTTVIADNTLIADAFSTAIFVLGFDNPALEYFTNFGIQAMVISEDEEKNETSGFDYFRRKGRK